MRKIHALLYTVAFLTTTATALTSCNTDYNPTDAIANTTLTENDYDKLLTGIYDGLQGFSMAFEPVIDDVSADNLDNVGWFPNTDNNTLTGSSYYVNNIWEQLYYRVQLANNLINLEEAKDKQSDEDRQIEAQARAMRAWFYERLCMFYGDVPLLTTNEADNAPRTKEALVWSFAKQDLEYAAQYAPDFSSSTYISKQAAKALLARTCLLAPDTVQDLARAAELAEEVIADGNFELTDDAAQIWQTKTSKEMIFSTINPSTDAWCPGWFLRSNLVDKLQAAGVNTGYGAQGRYMFPVDNALMNAFEDGDNRKAATVRTLTNGTTTTRDLVKYPGPNGVDPYPIVRIAEMYLIAAEAEGRENGLKWLNALRASRGLEALTAADITDDDAYEARIMQERRVEFVGEGLRWYDLRRWFNRDAAGKEAVLQLRCYQTGETTGSRPTASDAMNISEDGHELLWPVPTVARDNDSALSQNPGY